MASVDAAVMDEGRARLKENWSGRGGLYGWFSSVDHKRIGLRYLVTAFLFLILGGIDALIMRLQLAHPDSHLVTPDGFNQLFTMHGTTMIFWYAAPILSGFGNYLIPLVIGSRDMAFPRLNAFSYWTFLLSGLMVHYTIIAGTIPAGGWFAYVPLTGPQYSATIAIDVYAISLLLLSVSTTVGAINFVVTILKHRAPGMSISRLPLMAWSTLTASASIIFGLPPLTAALFLLELDRRIGTHIFDPASGGSPLLWQHLFWVFGHPWVYIIVLPATGMASMIIPTLCRRPIVGYNWVAVATMGTGVLGFGVWVHHMFSTGLPPLSVTFFSAASMAVSLPSGVQILAWIATIWAARQHMITTAFLFLLGFVLLFTIGGVSGVMTASVPYDWQVTDSYFIVAHLHYVLVGINFFPVMAAFYYWLPKMTGRLFNEVRGRWIFAMMFVGANLAFFPMHIAGTRGMPRRVYTYPAGMGWDRVNFLETIGAFLFALGILAFVIDVIVTIRRGKRSSDSPWGGSSMEWATSSPPPVYNFAVVPLVKGREPLHDDPGLAGREQHGAAEHVAGKQVWVTNVMTGQLEETIQAPHDTIVPFLLAGVLCALGCAVLAKSPLWTAATVLIALAGTAIWLWRPAEEP